MVNTSHTGGENGGDTGGGPAGWTDDVERFAHDERLDAEAQRRRLEHWQNQRRHDETTAPAALAAARGSRVSVVLCTGAELHGTVLTVGLDVAELSTAQGRTWVGIDAIDAVVVDRQRPSEDQRDDIAMADVVETIRGERRTVTLTLRSGVALTGEVVATGASIVLAPGPTRQVVVRPDAVAAIRG